MIATLAEIKTLTGLSADYDTQISALIPIVQNMIVDYTGNSFEIIPNAGTRIHKLTQQWIDEAEGSDVAFDATGKTITASSTVDYSSFAIAAGKDISVKGSNYNDGIYSVATVSTNVITVNEDLNDETSSNYVTVRLVGFPKSLKLVASQIIKHWLLSKSSSGVQSERLGDHSINYSGDLPPAIMSQLNSYRMAKLI